MTSAADAALALPRGKCIEPGCTAVTDGVCARGHDSPLDCDLFELEPAPEGSPAAPTTPARLPLPNGRALRPVELGDVLRQQTATRIVPLGTVKAGKTTLVAVLFEFLANRRLDGWTYVGSLTTLGFAERSHEASMRSNRVAPTTPRTSGAMGDQILHVCARRRHDDVLRTMLFADVSGEHVEALTSRGEHEQVLVDAVAAADHLLILVDGELAAKVDTRQNAIRHAVDLVHVIPSLPLRGTVQISVVLTKLDCFEDEASANDVLEHVSGAIAGRVGVKPQRFGVAARPRAEGRLEPGHGLRALFDHLMEPQVRARPPAFAAVSTTDASPAILKRVWAGR